MGYLCKFIGLTKYSIIIFVHLSIPEFKNLFTKRKRERAVTSARDPRNLAGRAVGGEVGDVDPILDRQAINGSHTRGDRLPVDPYISPEDVTA
jgi:hypothetical protein